MSDQDRAQDALEWYEAHKYSEGDWGINDLPKPVGTLAEFTGRFLALTETGPDYEAAAKKLWNNAFGEPWDTELFATARAMTRKEAKAIVDAAFAYLGDADA